MDLAEALAAHTAWKTKFAAYLRDPDGSLTEAEVSDEKACELGTWICREALTSSGRDRRKCLELQAAHTLFHLAAAKLAREVELREEVSAAVYGHASAEVIRHILRMKAQAPGAEQAY
jgi:hypothetical protein